MSRPCVYKSYTSNFLSQKSQRSVGSSINSLPSRLDLASDFVCFDGVATPHMHSLRGLAGPAALALKLLPATQASTGIVKIRSLANPVGAEGSFQPFFKFLQNYVDLFR